MKNFIAPYWDTIFPIDLSPTIMLPQGAVLDINPGDKVGCNTILAHTQYSRIGEQYVLDDSSLTTKWNILDGELVVPGDVLAVVKKGFRWVPFIHATTQGIISIQGVNRIVVLNEESTLNIHSGFIGDIRSIDLRKNSFIASMSSGGMRYLYSEGINACSGIIDLDGDSEIQLVTHMKGKLPVLDNLNVRCYIFDYVTKMELEEIQSKLERLSVGFCILGTKESGLDLEKKIKLVKRTVGKRVFIENGFLAATCWKAKRRTKIFATIKKGTRVIWKPFNKELISGKIIEFEEDEVTILSDGGEKYHEHYLNLWKE